MKNFALQRHWCIKSMLNSVEHTRNQWYKDFAFAQKDYCYYFKPQGVLFNLW